MTRSAAYCDGFREAAKLAVERLHEEGSRMNDQHAKRILDAAAFDVGVTLKRRLEAIDDRPDG